MSKCESGWKEVGDYCYHTSATDMNWYNSKKVWISNINDEHRTSNFISTCVVFVILLHYDVYNVQEQIVNGFFKSLILTHLKF